MAELMVDGDELVVRLSRREKLAAGHGDVRVPLTAVKQVTVQPDAWRALRGKRRRGLLVPGVLCLGVWRHSDGQDFVAVRMRRGGVVLADLRGGGPFTRIAVSAAEPQATAAAVRTAATANSSGSAPEPISAPPRPEAPAPVAASAPASAPEGRSGRDAWAAPDTGPGPTGPAGTDGSAARFSRSSW
ncbi:hypothetical protein GCM10010193_45480 [Kitasatospora atroaurantiaca]|uniref:Uncharacterized protein n=1 Tax=Kitasatospora atroaurantiaca TaxID=285545 RepID=A0A561EZN9_9ACTN|nr:hypothetical protein [Kitasatospora atroaurantiaca]TWE21070.1 hypothetical protein FB465_6237 [Kitasatospora atroaurantiaca]